jgi:hypothetical protein
MVERLEIEVAAELAVDPHQQIAVERGGHAERIVVGQLQRPFGLDEIGAEQQPVAGRQPAADRAQEFVGARRVEVADVRSEENREAAAGRARLGGELFETGLIRRLVQHNRDIVQSDSVRADAVSAFAETSTRWMVSGRGGAPSCTSRRSFSPSPEPSSTIVETRPRRSKISRLWASRRRTSARVIAYHGSRQIASKSAEPSPS